MAADKRAASLSTKFVVRSQYICSSVSSEICAIIPLAAFQLVDRTA